LPACRYFLLLPAKRWFSPAVPTPFFGRPNSAKRQGQRSKFIARTHARARGLRQPSPQVSLVSRRIEPENFHGATLAIAEVENAAEATRLQAAARTAGVAVNIIDKPGFSDFQFGAIVDRSPLVIGISTSGGAPKLAQALRGRLEALLPREIKLWAQTAKVWRERMKALDTP